MNLTRLSLAVPVSLLLMPMFALLGLSGCANDAGLRASGSFLVTTDGAQSGFSFPQERLVADQLGPDSALGDGRIQGHCLMEGSTVDIGLSRSSTEGEALSRFSLILPEPESDQPAVVRATLGDADYLGQAGANCSIDEVYREMEDAIVGAEGSCVLNDASGREAVAEFEVFFAGCTVKK